MNLSDIQAFNKSLDKIEDGLRLLPELSERIHSLEQRGSLLTHGGGPATKGATLGGTFATELNKHREQFSRARSISLEISTKGLVTAAQVGLRPSLGATPGGDLPDTLPAVAIRSIPMGGTQALTYARRLATVPEGAGAGVQNGEGALKNESTPTYSSVTQNRATVAAYANLSEQSLSSDAELQAAIDTFLQTDVLQAVSLVLVNGTTVASAAFAGFNSLALDSQQEIAAGAGVPELETVAAKAAMAMRAAGYMPTVIVVNPTSWANAVFRYGTSSNVWVNGSPFVIPALDFSGMRVAFSSAVDQNKALLVDERYVHWGIADSMRIDLNYVNDNFIKNIITVRCEMGVIPIVRDANAVRLARKLV